jgi:hypothetical protein
VNAETRHFSRGTHVHGDVEAGRGGPLRSGDVNDANLQPDTLGLDRNRFIDDLARILAATKDVDHVHFFRYVGQTRIHALAENELAGVARIDRDDLWWWWIMDSFSAFRTITTTTTAGSCGGVQEQPARAARVQASDVPGSRLRAVCS